MGRSALVVALQAAFLSLAEGVLHKGGSESELGADASQFPSRGFPSAVIPSAGIPDAGIPNVLLPNAARFPNAGLPNAGLPNAVAFPSSLPGPQLTLVASVSKMAVAEESCSPLKNLGTHSTVKIEVGTPGQKLDVVADTGSDNIIVASCVCKDTGHCRQEDKCFRGGSLEGKPKSSTFQLHNHKKGDTEIKQGEQLPVIMMAFGSGTVQAVIASDVVAVGSVKAKVKDSLLLMINQQLAIQGPFEGILGLGLPKTGAAAAGAGPGAAGPGVMPAPGSPLAPKPADPAGAHWSWPSWLPAWMRGGPAEPEHPKPEILPEGFLQSAKVPRFSICFNDKTDGVLRLNSAQQAEPLGSIGTVHWGLDFRGISIGDKTLETDALFCTEKDMKHNPAQQSPCGAIPDSGTTIMMAPAAHVEVLFKQICSTWKRCTDKIAENKKLNKKPHTPLLGLQQFPRKVHPVGELEVFSMLLQDCASWANESEDLNELPELHFHMRGKDKTKPGQTLTLPGAQYVVEAEGQDTVHIQKMLMGFIPLDIIVPTGAKKKMCSPAFGVHQYKTATNGEVWILGTPFFYQYQVGYDLAAEAPSMSFTSVVDSPCGQCQTDHQVMLLSQGGRVVNTTAAAGLRGVRRASTLKIRGPPRIPKLDTSLPL